MSTALAVSETTQSTLPEESGWFQPQPISERDFDLVSSAFTSRIKRELRTADAHDTREPDQIAATMRLRELNLIDMAVRRVLPRKISVPEVSLQPLQEWEGYVVEIAREKFLARLSDRTAGKTVESELAEFPIADVSDDDRNLLKIGGVFRWIIGYQRARGGTKRRVSQITFRRMPAWSPRELKQAETTAKKFFETIIWD